MRSFAYIGHSSTPLVSSNVSGGDGSRAPSTYRPRERVRTSVRTGSFPSLPAATATSVITRLLVSGTLSTAETAAAANVLLLARMLVSQGCEAFAALPDHALSRAHAPSRPR